MASRRAARPQEMNRGFQSRKGFGQRDDLSINLPITRPSDLRTSPLESPVSIQSAFHSGTIRELKPARARISPTPKANQPRRLPVVAQCATQ